MKVSGRKFYIGSMILGTIAMFVLLVLTNIWGILIMVFLLGLAIANVFPIIFSAALKKEPQRANEVSGLLIMGVAGGAVLPPIMGVVADYSNQTGAMLILLLALMYLLFSAFKMQADKK